MNLGNCMGKSQSPINLVVQKGDCDPRLTVNLLVSSEKAIVPVMLNQTDNNLCAYLAGMLHLYATDSLGMLRAYDSEYVQFKTPSEHFIEGKQYSLEL